MCREFNALPDAGGILDQDAYLMDMMMLVDYVRHLHSIPLKEYGSMDARTFEFIDRVKRIADDDN